MTLERSHARGPEHVPVLDLTIGDALRAAAAEQPDRPGLIVGDPDPDKRRTWTYAELLADAERVARALLGRFQPGDHITVWAPNIPEWVLLEMGIALAGMVLVTANPAYKRKELTYVLTQSRTKGLFVTESHRGNPMLATAHEAQADCPDLEQIVSFSDWDDFIASGDADAELPPVDPMDPVMIQYTSGTTGFPKGAHLHHRGLVNNASHYFDRLGAQDGDVYVTQMPLFHTAGSAMGVLGCLSKRCPNLLMEQFDPALFIELAETYRAKSMMGVPTMMVAITEAPEFPGADLSSLTAMCSGGSLVPEEMVRGFEKELGAPFTIVYGQTECSPVATMTAPDDTVMDKATTIGLPMPHVEIKIIDAESGETLPVGQIGELCTRGYHVMHGYFDMEEQTKAAIDSDGWLHTGDLASMDDRGYTCIEGRLKDMIIRGGENVYPKEIEEVLFAHESVGGVAVVGLPDPKWGETVAAFVRPAAGHTVDRHELFALVRESLAAHKTPKQWFAVEEFPLTGSGKIQKFKLRQEWEAGEWTEC